MRRSNLYKIFHLPRVIQLSSSTLSEKMIYPATSTNTGYIIFSESVCIQCSFRIHSETLGYTRLQFYDINLVSFKIAYHGLNEEIRSWPFLSKQIKTGGFRKCKVHCCNFKGFKVTSLQSLACLGFEPGPSEWVT